MVKVVEPVANKCLDDTFAELGESTDDDIIIKVTSVEELHVGLDFTYGDDDSLDGRVKSEVRREYKDVSWRITQDGLVSRHEETNEDDDQSGSEPIVIDTTDKVYTSEDDNFTTIRIEEMIGNYDNDLSWWTGENNENEDRNITRDVITDERSDVSKGRHSFDNRFTKTSHGLSSLASKGVHNDTIIASAEDSDEMPSLDSIEKECEQQKGYSVINFDHMKFSRILEEEDDEPDRNVEERSGEKDEVEITNELSTRSVETSDTITDHDTDNSEDKNSSDCSFIREMFDSFTKEWKSSVLTEIDMHQEPFYKKPASNVCTPRERALHNNFMTTTEEWSEEDEKNEVSPGEDTANKGTQSSKDRCPIHPQQQWTDPVFSRVYTEEVFCNYIEHQKDDKEEDEGRTEVVMKNERSNDMINQTGNDVTREEIASNGPISVNERFTKEKYSQPKHAQEGSFRNESKQRTEKGSEGVETGINNDMRNETNDAVNDEKAVTNEPLSLYGKFIIEGHVAQKSGTGSIIPGITRELQSKDYQNTIHEYVNRARDPQDILDELETVKTAAYSLHSLYKSLQIELKFIRKYLDEELKIIYR